MAAATASVAADHASTCGAVGPHLRVLLCTINYKWIPFTGAKNFIAPKQGFFRAFWTLVFFFFDYFELLVLFEHLLSDVTRIYPLQQFFFLEFKGSCPAFWLIPKDQTVLQHMFQKPKLPPEGQSLHQQKAKNRNKGTIRTSNRVLDPANTSANRLHWFHRYIQGLPPKLVDRLLYCLRGSKPEAFFPCLAFCEAMRELHWSLLDV